MTRPFVLLYEESLRNLVSLSTKHRLKLHHIDIHTAFLNGTLEEEVYIEQPVGFIKKGEDHLVCRLKKSICGLKQTLYFCYIRYFANQEHVCGKGWSSNRPQLDSDKTYTRVHRSCSRIAIFHFHLDQ